MTMSKFIVASGATALLGLASNSLATKPFAPLAAPKGTCLVDTPKDSSKWKVTKDCQNGEVCAWNYDKTQWKKELKTQGACFPKYPLKGQKCTSAKYSFHPEALSCPDGMGCEKDCQQDEGCYEGVCRQTTPTVKEPQSCSTQRTPGRLCNGECVTIVLDGPEGPISKCFEEKPKANETCLCENEQTLKKEHPSLKCGKGMDCSFCTYTNTTTNVHGSVQGELLGWGACVSTTTTTSPPTED